MNAPPSRLIPGTVDPDSIADAFEAIATKIQLCNRVTALQRAIDEHPGAYDAYSGATR